MHAKHFGTVACTALLKTLLLAFNLIFFVSRLFLKNFSYYLFFSILKIKAPRFSLSSHWDIW